MESGGSLTAPPKQNLRQDSAFRANHPPARPLDEISPARAILAICRVAGALKRDLPRNSLETGPSWAKPGERGGSDGRERLITAERGASHRRFGQPALQCRRSTGPSLSRPEPSSHTVTIAGSPQQLADVKHRKGVSHV